ncbi:unnamed protein product [Rangifer tarandus platyrhynchus]|uniref:Uncharacterized protein n=2 Tax=Rangifer tarandus platyrhynchus TaxID=3082113 RepID=A0ACB0DZJ1_RANTA|nr:unnamed protein product [Rangifer tarandus platyrhynchus]CAI9693609.1 unnamed protein product [Rangifer tarandus platyrhynchus]
MLQQRPHLLSLKYGQILHRDTRHEGKLCCGKSYDRDAHKGEAATRAVSSPRLFPSEDWRLAAPQVGPPTASRLQGPQSPSGSPAALGTRQSRIPSSVGPRQSAQGPPPLSRHPALPASPQLLRNRSRTSGGLPGRRPEGPREAGSCDAGPGYRR